jgi:NADH-quinone oxidoreductase subunit C
MTTTPTLATGLESTFQREEVDAAQRSSTSGRGPNTVDPRGLEIASETAARLVEAYPAAVTGWSTWRDEVTVTVAAARIVEVATYLRDECGFVLLSDLSPCDHLGSERQHPARFSVSWHVTKLVAGAPRIRLQAWVADGETVPSVMGVWPTADWHEREAYDFFGIEFTGRAGLRRLIMPDDWVGFPLRKDYPLGGEPVTFTNAPREL